MQMTLGYLLHVNAHNHPNREAVVFLDSRATFTELDDRVKRRANALLSAGIEKGDHVGTLFPNCMEVVESVFALWRIGAVVVPMNFRLSPDELVHVVDHADINHVLFHEKFEAEIDQIRPSLSKVKQYLCSGKMIPDGFVDIETLTRGQSSRAPEIEVNANDVATILYTSGTTGKPKGVVGTHENWVWSVANYLITLNPDEDKVLTVFPLFHMGAFLALFTYIAAGATMVFLKKFDPVKVFETIEKEKITRLGNPPTVYRMLLQEEAIHQFDLHSVTHLNSGSEVIPDDTRRQLEKVFPNAGVVENYGLTEACGILTTRREQYTDSKPASVGRPHTFVKIKIVDESGNDVACGEIGDIVASGPNIMQGYYKEREKTAETIKGGWLYTGDLGRFDSDGFLYIVERKHHMIISGGENIYPKEVEDVLYRYPKIAEAAVFGVADDIWGEKVCAAVVVKTGERLDVDELVSFCKQHLASYKKPRAVHIVESLPKSPIGKILRTALKKEYGEKK